MSKEMSFKSGTCHFGPTQPGLGTTKHKVSETGDHPRPYPLTELSRGANRCCPTIIVRKKAEEKKSEEKGRCKIVNSRW
jgi:hypothetical protein